MLPLLVIFRCQSSMVVLQYFIVVNMVFSYEDKIFIKNLRLSNSKGYITGKIFLFWMKWRINCCC